MKIKERVKAPTPKFFKVLRTIGLVLGSVSAAIISAPITLPAVVVTISSYLAVAGGVLTAVSQATVMIEPEGEKAILESTNEQLNAAISVGLKTKALQEPLNLISKAVAKTRGIKL